MMETYPINGTPTRTKGHWRQAALPALATALLMTAMAGGITALHARAVAERAPAANPPVAVDTRAIVMRGSYAVNERFAGLLEPARRTRLAFERSGLIIEILFDEGDEVAAGAVVARLETSRLKAQRLGLEADLKALQADHALAKVTLKRQSALARKGWQSQQKYDEARFKAAHLASSVEKVRAAIAAIDIDIAKSELKAPFSGTVAGRQIDEGSVINPGTPVLEVLESDVRRVRIGLSADAAEAISPGTTYTLASGRRSFPGRLITTRPDLQTGTRTVIALFEVTGASEIPFGGLVELTISRKIEKPGTWLPIAALSEGPKGLWTVLTVGADPETATPVAREAVEVLHVERDRAFVQGNLSGTRRIVINGTNRVIPGQTVVLADAR